MSLNILEESNSDIDIVKFYPFPTFRPGAEDALIRADEAFKRGKRFVMIDAPTGGGKSSIAVAIARKYNAPILTPTKLLQEQYAGTAEFTKEYVIKGKSNYSCGLPGQSESSVEQAICVSDRTANAARDIVPFTFERGQSHCAKDLKEKCANNDICEYYGKLRKLGRVPGAVANYDLIFRIKRYPGQNWGTEMGDTIVLDEAHQLISKVRDIFGFKFSDVAAFRLIGEYGRRAKGEVPSEWLGRVLTRVRMAFSQETDPRASAKFDNFIKRAEGILALPIDDENQFHIDDQGSEIEIKPLDMRYLKGKLFFPFKRVLLLSATFPPNFTELFGIEKEEVERVVLPSCFPKENRKIYFAKDAPPLNRDTKLNSKSETISILEGILAKHKDEKGIIHTGNYKFLGQLKKIYGKNKRFIWVEQDDNKDELYRKHMEGEGPTVLVSPSMMEGVDLKDDAARFGVILKVPYPALDTYTKKMMNIFSSWYDSLVATNIIQAYGRQVRTETDWANFYIIDGQFRNCLSKSKSSYSRYFIEAVKMGTTEQLMTFLKKPRDAKGDA